MPIGLHASSGWTADDWPVFRRDWAAIYNFSCIPLALMGLLPPWAAGLGMALSSLGVVLNSLRLGTTRWKSSTS